MTGRVYMSSSIKAWRPSSTAPGHSGLTIPYSGPPDKMSRELYESLLQDRIRELITQDPKEAQRVLTSSVTHLPDLYQIATESPEKDWPQQILACGQMQMCLDRIDWNAAGQSLTLPPNELPDLEAITEALPS